ncbi:MAG: hypothetical protein PS018_14770 [bacterium]|nr:hypothetical protein [bacterium]
MTAPAATSAPKARSPRYPIIGLKAAIERVRKVYDEDYQNKILTLDAAKHMGFGTLNGKALGVISALRKYGLLEGSDGFVRVTDLALKIIAHNEGDEERREAILEAANGPELFAAIEKRWPGGKVSDQALKSFLLTEKFLPDATDTAIRSYRETTALVVTEVGVLVSTLPADDPEPDMTPEPISTPLKPAPGFVPPPPPVGGREERVIDDANQDIVIRFAGDPSVETYEFLADYIALRIKRMKAAKKD